MSIDAMKQALSALECAAQHDVSDCADAITALRLAIEQAERQEPVCDKDPRGCWNVRCQLGKVCKNTAPPQRQPLTEEEIDDIWNRYCDEMGEASVNDAYDIARAIERAHGIGGGE
jgi:hypothetical protein